MDNDETIEISERDLAAWFLEQVPALRAGYEEVREWTDPDTSAFATLAFVLNPHIEELLEAGNEAELERIFGLLQYLAHHGDLSVKNELANALDELDTWKVWRFLPEGMREDVFRGMTSIPGGHVEQARYRERWREEIEKFGGLENFTVEKELVIRYRLVQEFNVRGLRAPEPGGDEWRRLGLRWPLPDVD